MILGVETDQPAEEHRDRQTARIAGLLPGADRLLVIFLGRRVVALGLGQRAASREYPRSGD